MLCQPSTTLQGIIFLTYRAHPRLAAETARGGDCEQECETSPSCTLTPSKPDSPAQVCKTLYVILYVRVIRTNSISYVVYQIFTGGQKPLYMIVSSHILHSGSHVRITVAVQPLLVECLNVL